MQIYENSKWILILLKGAGIHSFVFISYMAASFDPLEVKIFFFIITTKSLSLEIMKYNTMLAVLFPLAI